MNRSQAGVSQPPANNGAAVPANRAAFVASAVSAAWAVSVARAQAEANFSFRRIVELELDPVRGNFDAAHLSEIHRRIFQDLPGAGFADVKPGGWRTRTPSGEDWMKERTLSTVDGVFSVAYSRMDATARRRLDAALRQAGPAHLRGLGTEQFIDRIASLYAELDYAHPFSDGNSRALRTLTRQLARESGFDIDWARFARSPVGRDLLYIARDLGVNALALPLIAHPDSRRKIVTSTDRLAGNPDLRTLLRDVVRQRG